MTKRLTAVRSTTELQRIFTKGRIPYGDRTRVTAVKERCPNP